MLSQYADVVEKVARETGSYFLNVFAEMIQERDYKRFVENDEKMDYTLGQKVMSM